MGRPHPLHPSLRIPKKALQSLEGKQQGSRLDEERRAAVIPGGEQRRPPGANGQTSVILGYGDLIRDKGAQHVMFIYTIRFNLLYIAHATFSIAQDALQEGWEIKHRGFDRL